MRALLIDPDQKSITEIDFEGPFEAIEPLLGGEDVTIRMPALNRTIDGYRDMLYVADAIRVEPGDERCWFQIDSDQPTLCKGLVVGVGEPLNHHDARISIDELKTRIRFTRRIYNVKPLPNTTSDFIVTPSEPLDD